jgi:hypothetical protein
MQIRDQPPLLVHSRNFAISQNAGYVIPFFCRAGDMLLVRRSLETTPSGVLELTYRTVFLRVKRKKLPALIVVFVFVYSKEKPNTGSGDTTAILLCRFLN